MDQLECLLTRKCTKLTGQTGSSSLLVFWGQGRGGVLSHRQIARESFDPGIRFEALTLDHVYRVWQDNRVF